MKTLISFSNFKGTLTNEEACAVASQELNRLGYEYTTLPLGDGGKGTFSFLKEDPQIEERTHTITGAFGDSRVARSFWKVNPSGGLQVFLESTDAIGYPPLDPEKRDPLGATSRGLGEWLLLIKKDLGGAPAEVFIGLGDSAISDAGKGMLEILNGESFPNWKITVLCDVENPLCGPMGSAKFFSPQKGADPEQVLQIEKNHLDFAKEIESKFGIQISGMPRTGSAGGLAAALHVFLKGKLVSGSAFVLEASFFKEKLKIHDVLIVGEGRTDFQTHNGKAPWAAIQVAESLGKKSVLISGSLGEGNDEIRAAGLICKMGCGKDPSPQKALSQALIEALARLDYQK
jgi:glycerate kinase